MAVWCINIQYFDVHHNYPNTVRHYRHPTWIYLGDHINYYQFWCSPRAGVDWWNRDAKPGHEWLNRNPWRNKYASTEAIPNNIIIYNLLWYYPPNILSSRYVCWRFQGKNAVLRCLLVFLANLGWNASDEHLKPTSGSDQRPPHPLERECGKMKVLGFHHPVLFANHWYSTGMMVCMYIM